MSQNLTYIRGGVHTLGKEGAITINIDTFAGAHTFGAGSYCHLQHIAEDLLRIVKSQPDRQHPLLPHQTDAVEELLLMAADLTRIAKTWPTHL